MLLQIAAALIIAAVIGLIALAERIGGE